MCDHAGVHVGDDVGHDVSDSVLRGMVGAVRNVRLLKCDVLSRTLKAGADQTGFSDFLHDDLRF